jgi:predicted phage-related endonuclease
MIIDKPIYKPDLAEKSKQAKRLDLTIKTMMAKLEQLKKEIKADMKDQDFVCDSDGVILVTWYANEKNYFNREMFDLEYPDIYDKFMETRTERRFILK